MRGRSGRYSEEEEEQGETKRDKRRMKLRTIKWKRRKEDTERENCKTDKRNSII